MKTTSKAILRRNHITGQALETTPIQDLSFDVANPCGPIDTINLTRLLFYLHRRRGWDPPRKRATYLREAKCLIADFGNTIAETATLEAGRLANHPFGFQFIRRQAEEIDASKGVPQKQIPTLF